MNARALKVLKRLADGIRDALMIVGLLTVHELASKRWPDGTMFVQIALVLATGILFFWFVLVPSFLEGLREDKKPDPA